MGAENGPGSRAQEPATLRQERIARFIEGREFVRVAELRDRFEISAVTVRTDLDALAARGHVRRVRGGALPMTGLRLVERPFEETQDSEAVQKLAIARSAASLVTDNDTVLLDVGTTAVAVARQLVTRPDLSDVVVCTNSLNVALALEPAVPRFTVIVLGGTLRPLQHSLVGPYPAPVFDGLRVGTAFLGCSGIDAEAGVTNVNLPEAEVKRQIVRCSERRVVVADSTKVGQRSFAHVCDAAAVDVLVTDAGADPDAVSALTDAGVEVEPAR